jgi:DNA-binding transcriptional regulator YiaG
MSVDSRLELPAAMPLAPTPRLIRAAREAAGLSQASAAALVFASRSGWIKWERGERAMPKAAWVLFCQCLGLVLEK